MGEVPEAQVRRRVLPWGAGLLVIGVTVAVAIPYGRDSRSVATTATPAPPAITTQPKNAVVWIGKTARFSAGSSGSPTPTVTWQSSPNGSTWANVPNGTTRTLSFTPTVTQNGYRYRAIFTNSLGTATTTAALLTVRWNVTINFSQLTQPISTSAIGVGETGYESPSVLANDPLEQQRVAALHLGAMRMDLNYSTSGDPTSKIICGGAGCDTGPTGDQWIASIKGAGAQPVVIVETQSSVDAANMVRHFNVNASTGRVDPTLPNYVARWIVGNEPDHNGYSPASYGWYFNADYDAMKAVDPNIKIGGPTVAWYDATWIQQFLQLSGSRVDFVDFHEYAQQGCNTCTPNSSTELFRLSRSLGSNVSKLRALIQSTVPARAAQIDIQVGEWALDWNGTLQFYSNLNAVWTADALGNILANGGRSMFYGTKGHALKSSDGSVTDTRGHTVFMHLDDPQAPYWGFVMFTGAGLFRSVGSSFVASSTSLATADIFASNAKTIVAVNTSTASTTAGFVLSGVTATTVDPWQKNQSVLFNAAPVHKNTVNIAGGGFTYTLPPLSVTTFVLS